MSRLIIYLLLFNIACATKPEENYATRVKVNQEGSEDPESVIDLSDLAKRSKNTRPRDENFHPPKIDTYHEDSDELDIVSLLTYLQSEEERKFFDLGQSAPRILKNFILPINNKISSFFGMRNGKMHRGIDIPGRAGSEIKTSNEGTVVFSGVKKGYGNVIIISHSAQLFTLYAHNSKNLARVGDKIKHGQVIALMGNTGKSTGPHVHFEVRESTYPIDPIKFIKNQKK